MVFERSLRASVLAMVLTAVAASGCAALQPAKAIPRPPAPEEATAYYPLTPGWKWAYRLEKGPEQVLATYNVREVIGHVAVVEAGDESVSLVISPRGISRQGGPTGGDFVLKNPIREGNEWQLAAGKARVTATGLTTTVPAGTFSNCTSVEEHRTNPERILRTTYAAGIGPVALDYSVVDPESHQMVVLLRAELVGITRPGEDPLNVSSH